MHNNSLARPGGLLLTLAAFVIVVAGMKAAAPLLVPFLLALVIAILMASPFSALQRWGLPAGPALVLVLIILVGIAFLLGILIGGSLENFSREFPVYQARLRETTSGLLARLDDHGVHVSSQLVTNYLDPGKAMKMVAGILTGMGGMLANGFLILVTVIFVMLEAASFPDKWRMASANAEESLARFRTVTAKINGYMGIKALTSLATGVAIIVWLVILGVDYPFLWGLLAFLLNFVPTIGSIIAAVPAVILALLQLGVGSALLTAAGYLLVNIVIGTFLEPRFMGKGLGLSTLVVFLSLVLWGWVLGPVGMLLSVPLTMALKIALDVNDETRWIAVMLGPRVVAAPQPDDEHAAA